MEKLILNEIEKLVKERNELRLQLEEARELLRRRNDGMDKFNLDYPECPYCGAEAPEEEYINIGDMEERDIVCPECHKKYNITCYYSITYNCIGTGKGIAS